MIQESKDFLLFSTTGASMFPFIRWNEQILVKRVPPEKIGIGDVILFLSDKGVKVCHRTVKIEDKDGILWFQARGDRNTFYDEPVSQQAILGKVIAIRRKMHLIGLNTVGWNSFLYKFDCFFASCIFLIKQFLARIISFLQQCRLYPVILRPVLSRNIDFDYKILDEKTGYKFFAFKNNRIIASVYLNYFENNPHPGWWGWSLQVKLLYRRLGTGKELMKKLIEFARQKNACSLYANVCKENLASLKLCESLGFSIIAGSERFYESPKRTYFYMKMDL